MAKLNGTDVTIGDNLYDIITKSYYSVSSVSTSNFSLLINGSLVSFQEGGIKNGVERIFWHNPVIITPDKDSLDKLSTVKRIYEVL